MQRSLSVNVNNPTTVQTPKHNTYEHVALDVFIHDRADDNDDDNYAYNHERNTVI